MKLKLIFACAITLIGAVGTTGAFANTFTVTVGSQADIFLAGLSSVPSGFPANSGASGEGAGQLPTAITGLSASETLQLTASGTVSCCLGGSPTNGPDGGGLGGTAGITGYGNVGPYSGVEFPLVGVFGGSGLTTPWSIFVVGSSDSVTVPTGATTLYLGLPDALGFDNAPGYYNDNTGSFQVDVTTPNAGLATTPLPTTWTMMLIGLVGFGVIAYRGTKYRSPALPSA